MTKSGLLGAAMVLSAAFALPALAQAATKHATMKHTMNHMAANRPNVACDPRDPGNPYSQTYDFQSWSSWRRRGGWDTRAEWTCQPIPQHPFGTVF